MKLKCLLRCHAWSYPSTDTTKEMTLWRFCKYCSAIDWNLLGPPAKTNPMTKEQAMFPLSLK